MQFRPCIDIHNGKVKQIVGSTLKDEGDAAVDNFVSQKEADYYAGLYKEKGLKGGHVILLNGVGSEYYEATRAQAMKALAAYRGGLQVGGGINPDNAREFIEAGADMVIVTSYVFSEGRINYEHIKAMTKAVGREHLVLDMSCRKRDGQYYVVTDRWQKFTEERVTVGLLAALAEHCSEFLIHGVDVEGKSAGIDEELLEILSDYDGVPVTYAGGISSLEVLQFLKEKGKDKINATIGSSLDIFGGSLKMDDVINICRQGDN